jgi:hypothetical protein
MQIFPFVTASRAVEQTGFTKPTVNAALEQLRKLGIVEEITKRNRGRVYAYRAYLDILNEGGKPLGEASTPRVGAAAGKARTKQRKKRA